VPAEKGIPDPLAKQAGDGVLQPLAIVLRISRPGRTESTILAKWQIATQHGDAGISESLGHRHQQRSPAVGAGAMGEHQTPASRPLHAVDEAADGWSAGHVREWLSRWIHRCEILS